jgi:A/G-specific adenine glycosylase
MNNHNFFSKKLLHWNSMDNARDMPWKAVKDPYFIWLSEIILQQTRVNQGLSYYNAFIKAYPNLKKLALANDEDVFKLWEGLGYYSRCRNLLFTARHIYNNLNNKFPDSYDELLKLKGVGPYTAAAIASFAYNEVVPVVDGNVVRVLSRFFGLYDSYEIKEGKLIINKTAKACISINNPASYNQAIMDFGAIVCKPKQPTCAHCILKTNCHAYKNNKQSELPVKKIKPPLKSRYFNYVIVTYKNTIAIKKRVGKDIWSGLFEFYLVEQQPFNSKAFDKLMVAQFGKKTKEIYKPVVQKLTHQKLHIRFYEITSSQKPKDMIWEKIEHLKNNAFPITLKKFIMAYVG